LSDWLTCIWGSRDPRIVTRTLTQHLREKGA
jgi:hypothetical protein